MYYTGGNYKLTKEQFEHLKKHTTVKIRLVTLLQKFDFDIPGNSVANIISFSQDAIDSEISKKTSGLYDGF